MESGSGRVDKRWWKRIPSTPEGTVVKQLRDLLLPNYLIRQEVVLHEEATGLHPVIDLVVSPLNNPEYLIGIEVKSDLESTSKYVAAVKQAAAYLGCKVNDQSCAKQSREGRYLDEVYVYPGPLVVIEKRALCFIESTGVGTIFDLDGLLHFVGSSHGDGQARRTLACELELRKVVRIELETQYGCFKYLGFATADRRVLAMQLGLPSDSIDGVLAAAFLKGYVEYYGRDEWGDSEPSIYHLSSRSYLTMMPCAPERAGLPSPYPS